MKDFDKQVTFTVGLSKNMIINIQPLGVFVVFGGNVLSIYSICFQSHSGCNIYIYIYRTHSEMTKMADIFERILVTVTAI